MDVWSNKVCNYCGTLRYAIDGDHQCTVKGVKHPVNSTGNSFYVETKQLTSEPHLSRLSFRSVLKGYQRYRVDDQDFLLSLKNYLVVPEGTKYLNEIETPDETESIVVVFGKKVQREVELALTKSDKFLLDNPSFIANDASVDFSHSTYEMSEDVNRSVRTIKHAIISGDKDLLFFQQAHYDLMELMIKEHIGTLGCKDENGMLSTKKELYRRTRLAVDYIEANFSDKISISHLSKVASLSPFHFIRTFKEFYGITPVEYLGKVRLNYACYFLKNSDQPISEILSLIGFKNHSSFSRLFISHFGCSPRDYRTLNNKSNIRTIIPFLG